MAAVGQKQVYNPITSGLRTTNSLGNDLNCYIWSFFDDTWTLSSSGPRTCLRLKAQRNDKMNENYQVFSLLMTIDEPSVTQIPNTLVIVLPPQSVEKSRYQFKQSSRPYEFLRLPKLFTRNVIGSMPSRMKTPLEAYFHECMEFKTIDSVGT